MNSGRTIFAQLMDFVSPYAFRKCVARYDGEYKVQHFSCWEQFLCLAFAHREEAAPVGDQPLYHSPDSERLAFREDAIAASTYCARDLRGREGIR